MQRESICHLLGANDVRTVPVATAAAALEQLRASTYDCMVLDISLPDASGFELLEKMAEEDQYSFPPVIIYTGRSLSAEEEQRLRKYSKSIIIKGARSPERLLDEVTLFLHQVEADLPADRRKHAAGGAQPRRRLREPQRPDRRRRRPQHLRPVERARAARRDADHRPQRPRGARDPRTRPAASTWS